MEDHSLSLPFTHYSSAFYINAWISKRETECVFFHFSWIIGYSWTLYYLSAEDTYLRGRWRETEVEKKQWKEFTSSYSALSFCCSQDRSRGKARSKEFHPGLPRVTGSQLFELLLLPLGICIRRPRSRERGMAHIHTCSAELGCLILKFVYLKELQGWGMG